MEEDTTRTTDRTTEELFFILISVATAAGVAAGGNKVRLSFGVGAFPFRQYNYHNGGVYSNLRGA